MAEAESSDLPSGCAGGRGSLPLKPVGDALGGRVESLPWGVQWCGRRATHACRKGNVRHLSAQPEDALST